MTHSTFTYVTYIRATPEKLWSALTTPDLIKDYWFGVQSVGEFTVSAPWSLTYPDGRTTDTGEIAEAEPSRRLVIRWRHQDQPELRAEGESRLTLELTPCGAAAVRLSLTHSVACAPSHFIATVSVAWPMVLSNLKSLVETGAIVLEAPAR